jgi:hypothetical protein
MAKDPTDARSRAEARQVCGEDGWSDLDTARIRRVRPVESLELNVSSRAELNRPKTGFVRVRGQLINWIGPHDGIAPRSREPKGDVLTGRSRGIRISPRKLWSYVWSHRELALLTAQDFDAACDRAERSCPASERGTVADLVEPIAKFELQLAERVAGHAPTCFRLWIDGYRVGWPPTEDQEPQPVDSPPGTPLAAEARLPIPMYAHTYAYGPGPRRKHQRRFDVPWPGGKRETR